MKTFASHVDLRDKVHIDGDDSIIGVVIAVAFYEHMQQACVCWIANGQHYSHWIDLFRLKVVHETP